MIRGFVRLGLISIGVLIWVFLCLIMIRQISLGQNYADYSHPLLSQKRWVIARNSQLEGSDLLTWESLEALQKSGLDLIWHIPIQQNREGDWLAMPREENPGLTKRAEWLKLEDILTKYPKQKYLIEVIARDGWQAKPLFDKILTTGWQDTIAISSPSQRVLSNLHKNKAQWITSIDHASLLIGEGLAAFDLQALATLGGDLAFLSPRELKSDDFPRLAEELRRRKKRIILLDDGTMEKSETEYNADGVMTSRPRHFLTISN